MFQNPPNYIFIYKWPYFYYLKSRNNVLHQIVSLYCGVSLDSRTLDIRLLDSYIGKCYMMNGPRKVLMICSAWPRSVSYFSRKVFCIYLAIFLFKIRIIRFLY